MGRKLSQTDYNKIRRNIVKKLYFHDCFEKGHMLFDNLKSSVPGHLLGNVKEVLEDLVREGLVKKYGKTAHGDAYQLNIKKLKEIEEIIFG